MRKRKNTPTRIVGLDKPKEKTAAHSWVDGNGQFYDFQCKFKKAWPGARFENEWTEGDVTECSLTGFTGALSELVRWQTDGVTFECSDGRIVVNHKVVPPRAKLKVDPNLVLAVILMVALGVFIWFNLDKYMELIS